MPSKRSFMIGGRLVPEQEVAELSDEMVRLLALKDGVIAKLKEQRDRAMRLVEIARAYRGGTLDDALATFDAGAAAETLSLPETPYNLPDADFWRAMHGAPRDGTEVRVRLRPLDVRAYWDEELRVFVLSRPVHIESIVDAFGWKPLLTASPSLSPETP